jgi:Ser-tRNA(Ala) deacylase AlaX/predicted O-methyltransferase YrrM
MAQHQANCLRRWAQLAQVIQSGHLAERSPSVRVEQGDLEAFIGAMDNVSAPAADDLIRAVQPLQFRYLLDVGGASGTWTAAFLRACSTGAATLFDLPEVIPMARRRLADAGKAERVRLVAGDSMKDPLPAGADLAWVSAIVHQNSRAQNRELFAKVFASLAPGGRIAIRDLVMEPTRTRPVAGALFAVNMLVATEGGRTFTFDELREDLEAAGFIQPAVLRRDEGMNSVVVAAKPAAGVVPVGTVAGADTAVPKKDVEPRMHSAEHLLTATVMAMLGCGRQFITHLEKKKSKADYHFARELTPEEVREIERRVNAVVAADVPVREEFVSRCEAEKLHELRRLPDPAGETVRIVHMGDYDACPCAGPHVRTTKEIGTFRIVSTSCQEGALRIRFKLHAGSQEQPVGG